MPKATHVFYGIDKKTMLVEKYELHLGNRLVRATGFGSDDPIQLEATQGAVGYLFGTMKLTSVKGAPSTEHAELAKIQSDLQAEVQRLRDGK